MNKVANFLRTNLFMYDVEDPDIYLSCKTAMESADLSPIESKILGNILDMFSESEYIPAIIKGIDGVNYTKVSTIPTHIFTTAEQVFTLLTTCRLLGLRVSMNYDGNALHISNI